MLKRKIFGTNNRLIKSFSTAGNPQDKKSTVASAKKIVNSILHGTEHLKTVHRCLI